MRFKYAFYLATIIFLFHTNTAKAQIPNVVRHLGDRDFNNFMMRNSNRVYGNDESNVSKEDNEDVGIIVQKHMFRIIFKDSTSKVVYGMIEPDSTVEFLIWEDESVKKDDPARFKKIYPNQTQSLIRSDNSAKCEGMAADSCWLFKAISGKINVYSFVADEKIMMNYILYIQKDNGILKKMNHRNLWEMLKDNEKALALFYKDKYKKAILEYNGN